MLEYKDTIIRITTQDLTTDQPATKEYPGKEAVGTGIGYWIGEEEPPERTFYALTHLPTGYRMFTDFIFSEQAVQLIIEKIAPLIDWNRPLEQLIADPGYKGVIAKVSQITADVIWDHAESIGFVGADGRIWSV